MTKEEEKILRIDAEIKPADLMDFQRFKVIMETLIAFHQKRDRVSNFIEKEIADGSWCLVTYGNELEDALINMLADEFNCWFPTNTYYDPEQLNKDGTVKNWWGQEKLYGLDNDISEWLYYLGNDPQEERTVTINGEKVPIGTIEELYEYLIKYCKQ